MTTLARRDMLALSAAFALAGRAGADPLPGGLSLGPAQAFGPETVPALAKARAAAPWRAAKPVPQAWRDLTYDQYRAIWFDTRNALWRDTDRPARLEFFAPGLYFPTPVSINVVDTGEGSQRPVRFDLQAFDRTDQFPALSDAGPLGYSGFRIHGEIEEPGRFQEFAVFQGASYFRALGRGQVYGLSARGLALGTANGTGEEFPEFRAFWVEAPAPGAGEIVLHALLDSPSVTGAYKFRIFPGTATEMDVEARLFPRQTLDHVGLAAGTSMFFFDETNRHRFDDFRPAVHDSDGLLIDNGMGERLWRPLANPKTLQVSSFVDADPKGFGLMQRPRAPGHYADLEAEYHRRPSLWVTPGQAWGKGAVTLVEIPSDKEVYDNIVAYWRPRTPLEPGREHRYSYRLSWCETPPIARNRLAVINTRMGSNLDGDGRIAAIDFGPHGLIPDDLSRLTIHRSANRGRTSGGIVQRNPETGGIRLGFTFMPPERGAMELRAQLLLEGKTISEVWLYRWTP